MSSTISKLAGRTLLAAVVPLAGCSSHAERARPAAPAAGSEPASEARPSLPFDWNEQRIDWLSYAQAEQLARAEGRPILFVLYASWCSDSAAFVNNILGDEQVAAASKRFAMVRANYDTEKELVARVAPDMKFLPSLLFLDPAGQRLPIKAPAGGESAYSYPTFDTEPFLSSMSRALELTGKPPLDLVPPN